MRKLHRDGIKKRTKREHAPTGHTIHLSYAVALPERTELVARNLRQLNEIFARLFADENFLTLLRAESMPMIPIYLKPVLQKRSCGL